MNNIEQRIQQTKGKVDYYSKMVTPLLNKGQYDNFLNIYLKLLYENLIKYQTLQQVKLEDETLYAEENPEENTENEEE